ncbi:polysaccharide biosynthesis/export family protein [Mesoterricola sediminis]|uniref:Capsular polysaccharide transporter n=1 Tax=Mesoterricola sediminis TaxID=2927980 RepID=A0AA48GUL1_9BACT|nr:polysaccharide biosynthesis/export family protein [Mesoterricola sediminis]BDU75925.1 capsular polysaccharide transporter [Mesoterricola sediminis]
MSPALTPLAFAAAAGLLLSTACQAPGMKFNARPGDKPTRQEEGGLNVTLRRLDPEAVRTQVRPTPAATLSDLLVDAPPAYRIGPQDVLLATVWDHPEITLALGQYRTDNATGSLVDEEGRIFFPYVGQLSVKGLTTGQARAKLTAELAKVLQNPQVDLKVLAFRSQKVFVGGEVKTPASYNVTDVPFTLAEAINRAGGFTPTADDSRLTLTRGPRSWTLNFHALMTQGGLGSRVLLQDGDTLMVASNVESPIYMMGEVQKPGTLPLVHGARSLAQAISDAGGIVGASADARSIYVIRKGATDRDVDVWHLDARNPTAMMLADAFALNPRDIVYVDAGTSVRFNRVMNLILPTVQAVTNVATSAATVHYFSK